MDYILKIRLMLYNAKSLLFLFLLFPIFSACSSNQVNVVEIITPPKSPKVFSSIPDRTEKPKLRALLSFDEQIKDIKVGRRDPFLPPDLVGDKLLVPTSFIYHGQISVADQVNAFVSYADRKGTIKPGDIGGENTDLLPTGWTFLSLDNDTKVLTLVFDSQSVDVDLFPE